MRTELAKPSFDLPGPNLEYLITDWTSAINSSRLLWHAESPSTSSVLLERWLQHRSTHFYQTENKSQSAQEPIFEQTENSSGEIQRL
jgi:hypothetical protein